MNKICRLCGNSAKLKNSHFIPKSVYSKLDNMVNKKDGYAIMFSSEGKNMPLAKQITASHLCNSCEDLFNKNGEKFFIENGFSKVNLKDREEFGSDEEYNCYIEKYISENKPILVQKFTDSLYLSPKGNYVNNLLDVNSARKLFYFAISIFWRSSLEWPKYSSPKFNNFVLEEMRNYLLEKIEKISSFRLRIDIVTREIYAVSFPFPIAKKEGKNLTYVFHILYFIFTLEIIEDGCEQSIENIIKYGRNVEMSDLCHRVLEETYNNSEKKGKRPHGFSWFK